VKEEVEEAHIVEPLNVSRLLEYPPNQQVCFSFEKSYFIHKNGQMYHVHKQHYLFIPSFLSD